MVDLQFQKLPWSTAWSVFRRGWGGGGMVVIRPLESSEPGLEHSQGRWWEDWSGEMFCR